MKKNRVPRSKADLRAELKDQLQLLELHCQTYDDGREAVAKHIATSLRVLLHHHGSSNSLLEQLALRGGYFKDSSTDFSRKNLLPIHNLIALRMSGDEVTYVPSGRPAVRGTLFAEWWNGPVIRDNRKREFTRREIVAHVADTDGGAHVDPGLEEAYMDLSRNNSLGWVYGADGNPEAPAKGRPELACIRQIASEVLATLRSKAPQFFMGDA
jgi:hypothetical protein